MKIGRIKVVSLFVAQMNGSQVVVLEELAECKGGKGDKTRKSRRAGLLEA